MGEEVVDDDPFRTATYMRGFRNGMTEAAKLLDVSAATIRLHVGEMTAQEMRSVRAALAWKAREIEATAALEWNRVMEPAPNAR